MRWLAVLCALIFAPLAVAQTPRMIVLEGDLTRTDHETYRELPFEVPSGIERITITFTYARDQCTVIDLGLYDPNGFRGWSGGNKSSFTIASNDATPSYVAGPILPGTWRLLLGVPNVRTGATTRFRADIRLDPIGTPANSSAFWDGPLRPEAGWRRGDFHNHTGHSDGTCESLSGRRIPCPAFRTIEAAHRAGLDFVAVTDHNTASHTSAMRELQAYYDTLLLIPGREITTFHGHLNVLGPTGPLAFRIGANGEGLDALLDGVQAQGGIASINHPGLPSGEACMGCGWTVARFDPARIAAVEIANGGAMKLTGAADGPLSSIPFWQGLLDLGLRVTAIGGSDNHDPDAPANRAFPVGRPATVVYAENLSQRALLDGVQSGRVFVDLDGVANRLVDLSLTSRRGPIVMGGIALLGSNERTNIAVRVQGMAGGRVQLLSGAGAPRLVRTEAPVTSADETLEFSLPTPGRAKWWVRADVRDASGRLVLVSNPIYIQPR
jgi:hypothetical protein